MKRQLISTWFNARQGTYADNRSALISRIFTQNTLSRLVTKRVVPSRGRDSRHASRALIDRRMQFSADRLSAYKDAGEQDDKHRGPPSPGRREGRGRSEGYELYMSEAEEDETSAKEFPLRLRARSGAAGVEAGVPWVSVAQAVEQQEAARYSSTLPRPSRVRPR